MISWKNIAKPLTEDGRGLGKNHARNLAFLTKLVIDINLGLAAYTINVLVIGQNQGSTLLLPGKA